MRFRFLGTSCGNKLYGDTIGRYSFLVSEYESGFTATYRDLHFSDQTVSHFIGSGYAKLNDARLACEAKLKELTE